MKNIVKVFICVCTVFWAHNSFAAVYPPEQLVCEKIDNNFHCEGLDNYYWKFSFYQIDNPNMPVIYTLNKHGHKQGWYWLKAKWGEFLYENSSSQFLFIMTQPGIIMDASDTNWKKIYHPGGKDIQYICFTSNVDGCRVTTESWW